MAKSDDGTGRSGEQRQAPSSVGGAKKSASAESQRGGETLPSTGAKPGMPAQLGRYRVKKLLGEGGMGSVYLVENTELEREEALKVPHFEAGGDPDVRERFLREARSAAKLDHANLCQVYDVGELDGIYFLTMRYLKGRPLSDYTGKAQPARKVVEIVAKLAQALEYAHNKGVIHRDLKPNNVILCAGVGPVVMDFGLAKQTGPQNRQLTQLGTLLGTPAYMPPEQVKGELTQMGPASDVYSLGVILYQLLTGHLPFEGSEAEVFDKILYTEPLLPSAVQPGLNSVLDAICTKALAKAPTARYPSMKAFATALIDYLKTTPSTEGAGTLVPTKAAPADIFQQQTVTPGQKLSAGADVFQAQTVAPGSKPAAGAADVFQAQTVAPGSKPLESLPTPLADTKSEPECAVPTRIAPSTQPSRSPHVPSHRKRTEERKQEEESVPRTAPGRMLRLVSAVAGLLVTALIAVVVIPQVNAFRQRQAEARRLEEAQRAEQMAAEQKEEERQKQVAAETNRLRQEQAQAAAEAARLQQERERKETARLQQERKQEEAARLQQEREREEAARLRQEQARAAAASLRAAPSPAVTIWCGESTFLQVRLQRQGYSAEIRLQLAGLPDQVQVTGPVILPAGQESAQIELVAAADAPATVTQVTVSAMLDDAQAKTTVQLQVRKERLVFTLKGGKSPVGSVAFSPDGKRIVSSNYDSTVKVWDAEKGSEIRTLKGHTGPVKSVAFSADGKRLVSASHDNTVKVWDADKGTETLTLKGHTDSVYSVAFSPDGKRIVSGSGGFDRQSEPLPGEVKVWDTDKGTQILSLKGHTVTSVSFSPDGKRIVSSSLGLDRQFKPLSGEVKVWDADKGTQILSLKGDTSIVTSVSFSPDGKRIVSGSVGLDRQFKPLSGEVKVWDADKGTQILSLKGHTSGVTSVAFSPDGTRIVSGSADKTVRLWDANKGTEILCLKGHTDTVNSVSFSPDGKRLVSGSFDKTVKIWDAKTP